MLFIVVYFLFSLVLPCVSPPALSQTEMDDITNKELYGWGASRTSVTNNGIGDNGAGDDGFADNGVVDDGAAFNRRR